MSYLRIPVLDNCLQDEVAQLRTILDTGKRLVLLDTETNTNLHDYEHPLCAAELLRLYLLDSWPTKGKQKDSPPPDDQAEEDAQE